MSSKSPGSYSFVLAVLASRGSNDPARAGAANYDMTDHDGH